MTRPERRKFSVAHRSREMPCRVTRAPTSNLPLFIGMVPVARRAVFCVLTVATSAVMIVTMLAL
jgi:hypothetical protein